MCGVKKSAAQEQRHLRFYSGTREKFHLAEIKCFNLNITICSFVFGDTETNMFKFDKYQIRYNTFYL